MKDIELSPKIEKLKSEFKSADDRRQYWNETLKELLFSTLTQIQAKAGLDLHVEKNEDLINFQSVYIGFKNTSSGIVNPKDNVAFEKNGAFLFFSQEVNGKINVWMNYPYISGIKGEADKEKSFGIMVPEELDLQMILNFFDDFIAEVLYWECYLPNPIGFNR